MGHRLPPDFETGDDSIVCSPDPWEAGNRPLYVGLTATGMTECFPGHIIIPNGHMFVLKQDPGDANLWTYEGSGYWASDGGGATAAQILVFCPVCDGLRTVFLFIWPPECQISFPNMAACGGAPQHHAQLGTAIIQWGPDIGALEYNAQ